MSDGDTTRATRKLLVQDDAAGWRQTVSADEDLTGNDLLMSLVERHLIDQPSYRLLAQNRSTSLVIDPSGPLLAQLPENCDTLRLIGTERDTPLSAMFLGPKAENADMLTSAINDVLTDYIYWRKNYFPMDSSIMGPSSRARNAEFLDDFEIGLMGMLNELKEGFPFHSPRYMGHMLSGQTLPAIVGYFAGMLYNPNNVTDEAAPITVEKEIEYGRMICRMIGFGPNSWAHICSGGTLANLEALWVARLVQFLPLCIRESCQRHRWAFRIKLPNQRDTDERTDIREVDAATLLALQPNEGLFMTSNLLKFLMSGGAGRAMALEEAQRVVQADVDASRFNIRNRGFAQVIQALGEACGHPMRPVLFVPESAHYSFRKAANLLGYGEDAIRNIPIGPDFRIDVNRLGEMLRGVGEDEYVAAVVCVVGTTEEGAVDPVHKVKWLRDELATGMNRSFWLHVDSAWGGFVRTLFCDDYPASHSRQSYNRSGQEDYSTDAFRAKVLDMIDKLHVREDVYLRETGRTVSIEWSDADVYAAYMAMCSADSVTVDPHKLGYVPYPAGVVAFRNKLVTTLVAQDAPYISTTRSDVAQLDIPDINAVGSYIIEGSKPGAAALSCWFSAKMIPLDAHHHGKIIRTSLLNAKRFAYFLGTYHSGAFRDNDRALVAKGLFEDETQRPFMFRLLYENIDTNVVCFMVLPTYWSKEAPGKMQLAGWDLEKVNKLNEDIYSQFTINAQTRHDERKVTMSQRFFVSKTVLRAGAYNYESLRGMFDELGYTKEEYERHGVFVMRLTIMNPWYHPTKQNNGTDYLREFLEELHYQSRVAISSYDATPMLPNRRP